MDANETRYHLLLGRDDWANCLASDGRLLAEHWLASPVMHNESGLDWHTANDELTLQARLVQFATSPYDDKLTLDRRRGAGRDRYGSWYWIAESGTEIRVQSAGTEIRVQSAGTGRGAHFWSAGDGVDCEPQQRYGDFGPKETPPPITSLPLSGLVVTDDHYLVVGVLEPKGLLIFDLHAGGSPRQMLWPTAVDFVPFDMAPRPGGGVWILDRVNRRYWGLDRKLNVMRLDEAAETIAPADFQPIADSETRLNAARPFPEAITLEMSSPLEARDPIAIDALPDGSVIFLDNVLEDGFSRLYRYRLAQQLGSAVSLEAVLNVVDEESQSDFQLIGYDLAFVAAKDTVHPLLLGQVFVAALDGNQCYAFDVFGGDTYLDLQARAEFYPMRLFGGKAIVTAGGQVYYDFGENWLPLIEQKRPRYEPEATLITFAFDGKQPDCVWHRLLLDACIPPDSSVFIWSRTANEVSGLDRAQWWWQSLLHSDDLTRAVSDAWLGEPQVIPLTLQRLSARQQAIVFVQRLSDTHVQAFLQAVTQTFGLYELSLTLAEISTMEEIDREVIATLPATALPWQPWIQTRSEHLSPDRQVLLAVGLMLHAAPTIVRSASFAAEVKAWQAAIHTTLQPAPPAASRLPADLPATTESTTTPLVQAMFTTPVVQPDEAIIAQPSLRGTPSATKQSPSEQYTELMGGESATPLSATPQAAAAPLRTLDTPEIALAQYDIETDFGGVCYFINLGLFLNLYGDFTTPLQPGLDLPIWDFVALVAQELIGDEVTRDPIWPLLAQLADRAENELPGAHFDPSVDWSRGLPVFVAEQRRAAWRSRLADWSASPAEASTPDFAELMSIIRPRLQLALGVRDDELPRYFKQHARLVVSALTFDAYFALADLPIEIRLSGLDRDPGWVPAAGRTVRFHYD